MEPLQSAPLGLPWQPEGHVPAPWGASLELLVAAAGAGAHLLLGEVQGGGEQAALLPHQVLLPRELLLQPCQLLAAEDGPDTLGFARLGFEQGEATLGDQEAWR